MDRPSAPRHFRRETDADGVLWLSIDKHGSAANTLSDGVVGEIESVLDELESDLPRALVVRSAKDKGFVAGTDIAEFVGLSKAGRYAKAHRVQCTFDRIEALKCNAVSLVHGYRMGGGLELVLATRTGSRGLTPPSAHPRSPSGSIRASAAPRGSWRRRRRWS